MLIKTLINSFYIFLIIVVPATLMVSEGRKWREGLSAYNRSEKRKITVCVSTKRLIHKDCVCVRVYLLVRHTVWKHRSVLAQAWRRHQWCHSRKSSAHLSVGFQLNPGQSLASYQTLSATTHTYAHAHQFKISFHICSPEWMWRSTQPWCLTTVLEVMSTQVSAAFSQKTPMVRWALWDMRTGTEPYRAMGLCSSYWNTSRL